MRRALLVLALLGAFVPSLNADVILPESGRLAGPVNTRVTEFGQGFFFYPEFMEPTPQLPFRSKLSGWVEVEFGEPSGDFVKFQLKLQTVGTDESAVFGGGQIFDFGTMRVITDLRPQLLNEGDLNLRTGEISNLQLSIISYSRTANRLARTNRLFMGFTHSYPEVFSSLGFPVDGLPPGFLYADMQFRYDSEGQITGIEFYGSSLGPVAFVAFSNTFLQFFPNYFFGLSGEGYWPNPDACVPGTPEEDCPTDEDDPQAILLPLEMTLNPHLFVKSEELREVPADVRPFSCAPADLAADGAVAAAAGKIFVIGGQRGDVVTRRVETYDPATDIWSRGAAIPTGVVDSQVAFSDGKIYVIGGRQFPNGPATPLVQIYDPVADAWSTGANMPLPVAAGGAVAYGERIFVLAGKTNRPNGSPSGNLRFNGTAQVYDPETDTWDSFPANLDGPLFLEEPSVVVVGSDLYLIGGKNVDGEVSDRTVVYDLLTRRFLEGPTMKWGVYDAAAGALGSRIFVAGGRSEVSGPTNDGLQVLELELGEWYRGWRGPQGLGATQGAMLNGALHIVGGRHQSRFDTYPGRAVPVAQRFDPATGWAACDSRPVFSANQVLNTASLVVGPEELSPGSQASIVGFNLAPGVAQAPVDDPVVPTELAGVSVTVDGQPSPVLAVEPNRIDFQIPYGVSAGGNVEVEVRRADLPQPVSSAAVAITDVSPGIFIQTCGVTREVNFLERATALACNADGSFNYATNAVRPGETVKVQMTGLGPVTPALANGERASAETPSSAVLEPSVRIKGASGDYLDADVVSVELAPGEIGIYDVEIRVPQDALIGPRVAVEATLNGVISNLAVISVGEPVANQPITCRRDSEPDYRHCVTRDGIPAPPVPVP